MPFCCHDHVCGLWKTGKSRVLRNYDIYIAGYGKRCSCRANQRSAERHQYSDMTPFPNILGGAVPSEETPADHATPPHRRLALINSRPLLDCEPVSVPRIARKGARFAWTSIARRVKQTPEEYADIDV